MSIESYSKNDVVKLPISVNEAVENWKKFLELKSRLLDKSDYQNIGGKVFIKKSGWRKLAQVFNITDSIVSEKRTDREDGSILWEFEAKATAPNGRYSIGVGSCDSRERNFSKKEHDVKSTAHTRSKSRAISDLIGGGEVSAEEIDVEEKPTRNVTPQK